jgi:Mg2+ and Co2+ transporter CorA
MNTTDLEREYLQEMLDLFQTRVSTELNRFVRKVTAWGSVGLAWTVIVGLYGMNFTPTDTRSRNARRRPASTSRGACGRPCGTAWST